MRGNKFIWLGLSLTIVFGLLCLWLGSQQICTTVIDGTKLCESNFEVFFKSPPNEKGDTLAGIAGSLAFLWIIITVLIQSNELSLQRQELSETRTTLQKQTSFLASQHDERLRIATNQVIEQKLKTLKKYLSRTDFEKIDAIDLNNNTLFRGHMTWITNKSLKQDASFERYIKSFNALPKNTRTVRKLNRALVKPGLKRWIQAKAICEEILIELKNCTIAMQERILSVEKIRDLDAALELALSNDIWGENYGETQS